MEPWCLLALVVNIFIGRGWCGMREAGWAVVLVLCFGVIARGEEPFRPEAVRWVAFASDPLFTGTGVATWDNRIRERGWIHRDGNLWRLWYTGYDGTKTGIRRLGLALSTDGLAWTRVDRQPLLADLWVEDVTVWPIENRLEMFAEGEGDRAHRLTSVDGRHWQPQGRLNVVKVNGTPIEDGPYGTPTIWFENGIWNLFYERRDLGIWLAQSQNMQDWENVQDEPVMLPGPHGYDRDALAMNQIVKFGSRYYAVMHGTGSKETPRLWNTYFAWSEDLVKWTKSESAVFPESDNKSSGQLLHDGTDWRLYTVHDRICVHRPVRP